MQRIRLAWLTNGLTQNCWSSNAETTAKQPHPTTAAKKQPHPMHALTTGSTQSSTAVKKQPHPSTQCSCCSNSPSTVVYTLGLTHNQAKKARLYTAAKQLKPLAKRAASNAMMKQNWHALRGRGRSRNTESSTKWTLDNFKTCMVAKKKLQQAECRTFLHGWTYTLILVISHDIFIICLMPEGRFVVSALWLCG